MTMTNPLDAFFGRGLFAAPQVIGAAAVERSRVAALAAARAIDGAKTPSHQLAEAGLRMNKVFHMGFARLVSNQVQVLDGLMDEGVRRLELAAEASGLRPLLADQIELFADTRTRLSADARRTLAILADTRTQLGEVFASPATATSGAANPRAARSARAVTKPRTVRAAPAKAAVATRMKKKTRTTAKKRTVRKQRGAR